jgi:hypothetical protein
MQIRSIALLAMSIPVCVFAASSGAPLAIYYSFDTPPSAAMVTEMQTELNRILADAGVRVAWRALESPRNGEDFRGIVILRFRGVCSLDLVPFANERRADRSGQSLAETDVADGHVLPFAAVDCDRVRRFIAPALQSAGPGEMTAALGRAAARVSAHEIYHMVTGSEAHAARGIARASHSRADLTAPGFAFAPQQADWLRSWAATTAVLDAGLAANPAQAESTASDAGASAGR